MSRPPFSLTDDQARYLVQRVSPLLDRYPLDPRDHRQFLRAFLRAVHEVTGKLYGPDKRQAVLAPHEIPLWGAASPPQKWRQRIDVVAKPYFRPRK